MSKGVIGTIAMAAAFAIPIIGPAIGLSVFAAAAISTGIMLASSVLLGPKKPKMMVTAPTDRLQVTMDTTAPRKICFGDTAMAATVAYL